jgi:predicted MPP superfamily phosphohydrolase
VVLSHDPKSARLLAAHRPALVLSGHTHGGQVYLRRVTPFLAARVGLPFLAGLFEVDGGHLYVNRGLGAALPVRFHAPPELTVLTLRAAALRSSSSSCAA